MTTNEKISLERSIKIAKWLGMKQDKLEKSWWFKNNLGYILDFLHDRNQQKWIIDELIKKGYRMSTYISEYGTTVQIWHNDYLIDIKIEEKITEGEAFLQAVEQLIDQEEKK